MHRKTISSDIIDIIIGFLLLFANIEWIFICDILSYIYINNILIFLIIPTMINLIKILNNVREINCPICLEKNIERNINYSCGHCCHMICFIRFIECNKKNSAKYCLRCPLCRA